MKFNALFTRIRSIPIQCIGPAWIQATLPVKYGVLGARCVVTLAACAFLASASACYDLIHRSFPTGTKTAPTRSPGITAARAQQSTPFRKYFFKHKGMGGSLL